MHGTLFYRVASMTFPLYLLATARGSSMRWPATTAALVYSAVRILMGWILPLWSAEPKLGPIWNAVDHMVAMPFPLLLVVPAFAIDLLMHRMGKESSGIRDWATAPLYGLAFLAALFVAQWSFAYFLMSPAARNWFFFVGRDLSYGVPHSSNLFNSRFPVFPQDAGYVAFAGGLSLALVYATLSARVGLAWGRWMSRVLR
jgi:hypothetical protein